MGQYYKVINLDKKEYMKSEYGLKLMEWSYNRNSLVLNLMKKLANEWKGDRVFVVGDYAVSDDYDRFYDYKKLVEIEKEIGIYKEEDSEGYSISLYHYADDNFKQIPLENIKNEEYKYIYNHNKKQYVDLEHCPLAWLYKDDNDKFIEIKIAPISLLLALGNGRGGGDYRANNKFLVGNYLDDVKNIEITKEPLNNDYTEFRPEFYEGEYIPYSKIKDYIKEQEKEELKNKENEDIEEEQE